MLTASLLLFFDAVSWISDAYTVFWRSPRNCVNRFISIVLTVFWILNYANYVSIQYLYLQRKWYHVYNCLTYYAYLSFYWGITCWFTLTSSVLLQCMLRGSKLIESLSTVLSVLQGEKWKLPMRQVSTFFLFLLLLLTSKVRYIKDLVVCTIGEQKWGKMKQKETFVCICNLLYS